MSRLIFTFDPATEIDHQMDTGLGFQCTQLKLINNSKYILKLEFSDGSQHVLDAWTQDIYRTRSGQTVSWSILDTLSGASAPISKVYGIAYTKSEPIEGTYPMSMLRQAVIGGSVTTSLQILNGTSFPSSPSDNDVFYRSDRHQMYFYSAAYGLWLSTDELPVVWSRFETAAGSQPYTVTTGAYSGLFDLRYDVFLTNISTSVSLNGIQNAIDYWTWTYDTTSAASLITNRATFSGQSLTGVQTFHTDLAVQTSDPFARIAVTKNGSPGSMYIRASGWYRKVG